ncbi:MAG TPA: DUF2934 domain-containing protein [Candidatus Binatia bacterium]|nr:DUF2934 domain-containing protein [Candidatus Binatia bacterium]
MPRQKSPVGSKAPRNSKANPAHNIAATAPETAAVVPAATAAPIASIEATSAALANAPAASVAAHEAAKTTETPAPEPRRFEVVKNEPRAAEARTNDARMKVQPINLEEEIRRRAYEIYQQRAGAAGSEAEDWFRAEREVRQRYHQNAQSA